MRLRGANKKTPHRCECGTTLIEVLVALVIIGTVGITFIGGVGLTSRATFITDEVSTAKSLAQSQMEKAKTATYVYGATEYLPGDLPGGKDYNNYSVSIAATPLRNPDDGIQKIAVTVMYSGRDVVRFEDYKVDR
ncbi:MAG: type II secretion system protein [Chloroflexi bacterium]|nr:type II secretion system protein [Chloroflexota bacterium]